MDSMGMASLRTKPCESQTSPPSSQKHLLCQKMCGLNAEWRNIQGRRRKKLVPSSWKSTFLPGLLVPIPANKKMKEWQMSVNTTRSWKTILLNLASFLTHTGLKMLICYFRLCVWKFLGISDKERHCRGKSSQEGKPHEWDLNLGCLGFLHSHLPHHLLLPQLCWTYFIQPNLCPAFLSPPSF